MKNNLLILAFLAASTMLCGCSEQDELKIPESDTANQEIVTNPIIDTAISAYNACYPSSSRSNYVAFYESGIVPIVNHTSRVASPDTVIYIVNEAEGKGFVALTGGNHPEVLAVSDNGTITSLDDIDNPGLEMFFDAAKEYSVQLAGASAIELPEVPVPAFKEVLITEADETVTARCTVQWGQAYPEGMYCPNKIAGCGPVAAAQLLSYFELPDTINLTYNNADKDYISLNWPFMKSVVKSVSWSEYNSTDHSGLSRSLASEQNLGRLCRELGHEMKSVYNPTSTSTYFSDVAYIIRKLCPTLNVKGYYSGAPIARRDIGNGIILMKGESYTSSTDIENGTHKKCSGHAWIIDGYKYRIIHHQTYLRDSNGDYVYSEDASFTERLDVQHINWGWRGQCNGYFNLNVFYPSDVTQPDTDSNYSSYDFSHSYGYYIVTK